MPVWTPETEGFAPFDEDDELREDLPSELANFIKSFDIQKKFLIEIKLWKNEAYSGRPALVARMEGMVPDYNSVVRLNGPGYYGFDTTWTPKGGKPRTEMLKVALVGEEWKAMYKEAQKDRKRQEIEEERHEAELERARNGGAPIVGTSPKDSATAGREYMKSMLGDMKDLADTFGMGIKPGGGGGSDNAMAMMFMGMMQMMAKQSENSTNLLISVLGNQNKGNDLKETMGLFRDLVGVRDSLMPKDRSWIEEIVGAISDNLPSIAGLFMRGNPEDDPMHQKMNEGLAETREKAQEDPTFAKALVKHLDKKVGPKMTDKILKGFLNIKRPAGQGAEAPAKAAPEAEDAELADGEAD
jgi:hypothetical protein